MRDSGFVGKPWLTLLCGDMGASSGLDSHRERHSSSTKAYGTVKITIPEQLKADLPQSSFGKLLTATPVVMTVLATMLAGLASSEMTRAQYDRALAAQQQSKAGDQWSFFQAKRLRGAIQRNSSDLLQSVAAVRPLDRAGFAAALAEAAAKTDESAKLKTSLLELANSAAGQQALGFLQRGELPSAGPPPSPKPNVKTAMDAVEMSKPDEEMARLLTNVSNLDLEEALRQGRERAQAFDDATRPVNQIIDQLDSLIARLVELSPPKTEASAGPNLFGASPLQRDFTAARLRYAAVRYETEARLNQGIANLYELQVRKSNASAERHHARSQRFFYGMLAAQMAVIIATFAIAARQRNLLWSIAAAAGLAAIGLGIYVYLYV